LATLMTQSFTINSVYPWGRNRDEYLRMFELDESYRDKAILDCAGGPSSFNAESTAKGWNVISVDPLYQFSAEEIRRRIDETNESLGKEVLKKSDRYSWNRIGTPEELIRTRMDAMTNFLADYDLGLAEKRHINAALPTLPFAEKQFDLALVSHFLFLYEGLGLDFHMASLNELLRVAKEVRIFPLVNLPGATSQHLLPVWKHLKAKQVPIELVPMDYEVQIGGSIMLRLAEHVPDAVR